MPVPSPDALLLLLAFWLIPPGAAAAALSPALLLPARGIEVSDDDGLRGDRTSLRPWGIDTPELDARQP